MSTAEWFGLFVFLIVVSLLFFAAFGGSNITEKSVEEYISRLLGEDKQGEQK
tara:strand:- start:130 stop:285 length:156 start_codon:yes stop_codon:yes gene_type:complete